MNDFSPHPRAGGPLPATTSDEDTVAVRTRVWCTAVMITVSAFMCLVQTSFAATRYINNPVNAMYVWFIASSYWPSRSRSCCLHATSTRNRCSGSAAPSY